MMDVAVSPDAYEAFSHSYRTVLAWALAPADDHVLDWLIEKGRRDAKAWAQSMHLV